MMVTGANVAATGTFGGLVLLIPYLDERLAREAVEETSCFPIAVLFVTRSELKTTERDSNLATFIPASTYGIRQREVCYEEGSSWGA
jgi:hypothetical protein